MKRKTMKTKKIVCAIAAASLSLSGVAFAQGGPNGPDDGRNAAAARHAQRDGNRDRPVEMNRHDHQRYDRHADARNERHDDRRYDSQHEHRGAGPDHRFYRGGRLPPEYRGRQYVVDDWREHHLSAPPRGYHWVQTGDDYVLAAIATGIIASILLNSH